MDPSLGSTTRLPPWKTAPVQELLWVLALWLFTEEMLLIMVLPLRSVGGAMLSTLLFASLGVG